MFGDGLANHIALKGFLVQDRRGNGLPDKLVQARSVADFQHVLSLLFIWADVSGELGKPIVTRKSLF